MAKYRLSLTRKITARHFLTGGDWGDENREHGHDYEISMTLQGKQLDIHGYLIDVTVLDGLLSYFDAALLNELPEFAGLNPSIEHLSRILCRAVLDCLGAGGIETVEVKIWETPSIWASCAEERG